MALAIWLYLIAFRGGFWRAADRDDAALAAGVDIQWPAVTVVIPARDEADSIGQTVTSLLRQDYPGAFHVVVVDDQSRDGTADLARGAAVLLGGSDRLTVVSGEPLAPGWTGKLWAQHQGVDIAGEIEPRPTYLLLTDADITYAPDAVTHLVARSERDGLVLNSLMAKLRCKSFAERMLVPAFIFFFQMLYPFAWARNPRRGTAAAAGGCMLVRFDALAAAGGVGAIRGALIDDCSLAKLLKRDGPIAISLTERVTSIRDYPKVGDIRRMVSRTAYAQLRYSPLLLAGTVLGLGLTYLAPVALTFFADGLPQFAGLFAWLLMALAFRPTLRFYGLSRLWAPLLPLIAAVYMAFTLDSAYQHARGRGGMWKGRAQANISEV
jgi:hopene-associated glycosyltransferase HpnB